MSDFREEKNSKGKCLSNVATEEKHDEISLYRDKEGKSIKDFVSDGSKNE